ncbi:MAG: helix-turn-helix domain-containing protein [Myxococcota bacterium]
MRGALAVWSLNEMARRRSEDQGDTPEEITVAAFKLFGRFGYDGVSMSAVATEAGIKKASLYYHFPSKEALFAACNQRLHRLLNEIVIAPMRSADGVLPGFLALLEGLKSLLEHDALADGIAGFWLNPSTAELSDIRTAHIEFTERATLAIAETLQQGIDAEQMVYQGDVNALARSVLAVVEVIALPLQESSTDEVRSVIDHLGKTFILAYLSD